jgi:hypothetical protein
MVGVYVLVVGVPTVKYKSRCLRDVSEMSRNARMKHTRRTAARHRHYSQSQAAASVQKSSGSFVLDKKRS